MSWLKFYPSTLLIVHFKMSKVLKEEEEKEEVKEEEKSAKKKEIIEDDASKFPKY